MSSFDDSTTPSSDEQNQPRKHSTKAPSEKHLEDWIVNNFNRFGWPCEASGSYAGDESSYWLDDDTFISPFYSGVIARQFPLPHGIADLLLNNWSAICVVELKKGAIDGETIAQCTRYMFDLYDIVRRTAQRIPPATGIAEEFWEIAYDERSWADPLVTGCVIGHSIKDTKLCAAMTQVGISCILYDYDEEDDAYTFEEVYAGNQAFKRRSAYQYSPHNQAVISAAVSDILEDRARHAMHRRKVHGDE